jgi:hypothetical protein
MKKTIQLFLLLFLMSTNGKAQITNDLFINSSFIAPTNPTVSDSIFLVTNFLVPAFDIYNISSSTSNINGVIRVSSSLSVGQYFGFSTFEPLFKRSSVFIGSLSSGDYELIYKLYNQVTEYTGDTLISPSIIHRDTLYFTVQEATDCNQIITELNIPLNLTQGWNMIGYTCVEPLNVIEAFSTVEDKIIIVKDNLGNSYLPDWEFNGIGDLEFAKGYQLKITEDISDFYFCPTLIYSE